MNTKSRTTTPTRLQSRFCHRTKRGSPPSVRESHTDESNKQEVIQLAKCDVCEREMLTASGCLEHTFILNDKSKVKALKAGGHDGLEEGERCHDCNAQYGQYHHVGCDMERCPNCGGQFISCDCDYSDEMLIVKERS